LITLLQTALQSSRDQHLDAVLTIEPPPNSDRNNVTGCTLSDGHPDGFRLQPA
jgi:hypothetical protein